MAPKNEASDVSIVTRCSFQVFQSTMEALKTQITKAQLKAIKATPFYHFTKGPKKISSLGRLEAILDCYDVGRNGFLFGAQSFLSFASSEFSCVLGLQHVGLSVHSKLVLESRIIHKYFDGKTGNVTRSNIVKTMTDVAGKAQDGQDFARLFILFVFNCILFPMRHLYTPPFVIHYVDDLQSIGQYAWGRVVHKFLLDSIVAHASKRKRYIDGCSTGLIVWVLEWIPELAIPTGRPEFPRFRRWGQCCPTFSVCKKQLRGVKEDDIFEFIPLPEEAMFLRMKQELGQVLEHAIIHKEEGDDDGRDNDEYVYYGDDDDDKEKGEKEEKEEDDAGKEGSTIDNYKGNHHESSVDLSEAERSFTN